MLMEAGEQINEQFSALSYVIGLQFWYHDDQLTVVVTGASVDNILQSCKAIHDIGRGKDISRRKRPHVFKHQAYFFQEQKIHVSPCEDCENTRVNGLREIPMEG